MTELIPVERPGLNGEQYYSFICSKCGKEDSNTYSEPYRTDMLTHRMCWHCNYWREFEEKNLPRRDQMTIIGGAVYGPGNRTSGSFRGMAGRRFDIEYIAPSVHAGKRITTFDLWYGSEIPDEMKPKFPDTARFLGDAERANVGGTTCFNPSSEKSEPYPLPRSIGIV